MALKGINFRANLASATDPAGFIQTPGNEAYKTSRGGIDFGQLGSNPYTPDDLKAGADPRLQGFCSLSTFNVKTRIDIGVGNFDLYLGAASNLTGGAGGKNSVTIWDGLFQDDVTNPGSPVTLSTVNTIDYPTTGTVLSAVRYIVSDGALWRTTGGTTAGIKPTGAGPVTDGSVTWTRLKNALVSFVGTQDGTLNVFDANGIGYTYQNWPSAPPKQINVTSGFVTMTRGEAPGMVRTFGWEAAETPLEDTILRDEDDKNLPTDFAIYANQPAGKFVAKLAPAPGTPVITDYDLSGTFAGDPNNYFELIEKQGEIWLVSTANRLPDNATAGTIVFTLTLGDQTNVTTFTPTLVSSQGRPVDDSVLGQISTQAWLSYKIVKDKSDAAWQGFVGVDWAGPYYSDVSVADEAALVTALNNAATAIGGGLGRKCRIRLQNKAGGVAWGGVGIPSGDYLRDGTCGVLIEPDAGHDPAIEGAWVLAGTTKTPVRGIEFKGLRPTGNGSGSYNEWLRVYAVDQGLKSHVFIVRNCRAIGKNWVQNTFAPWFNVVNCGQAEVFRFIGNTVIGAENVLNAVETHIFESAYNDFQQHYADTHGMGWRGSSYGVYEDNNYYHWQHHNVERNNWDGFIDQPVDFDNFPHVDIAQDRRSHEYPGYNGTTGVQPRALGEIASVQQTSDGSWNLYRVTTAGSTAGSNTGPQGTGTDIVDGTVHWQYIGKADDGPKTYVVMNDNTYTLGGTAYGDGYADQASRNLGVKNRRFHNAAVQVYHSEGYHPLGYTLFNNVLGSAGLRAAFRETACPVLNDYIEFNTFVGPVVMPPAPPYADGSFAMDATVAKHSTAVNKIRSRFNIAANFGTGGDAAFSENDVVATYKVGVNNVTNVLTGPFEVNSDSLTVWPSLDNSGENSLTEYTSQVASMMAQKEGISAGAQLATSVEVTISFTVTGDDGGTADFSIPITVNP